MLTFTVEELIRFLSNWTMTFFEGAKRSGDIVFSRYYSFFKRPVLVREHQVESLYVMVQNRDSSDNKKPSFSRFAKWEFGGFIVDSKTIYMASKPVKALLQSSDFIDDMDVFEKLDSIRIPLFRKNIPADPAMFQDKDAVDKAVRNACSAFLFGTRCNEFSNLIRTMYPLNDDDVIHYLSSPSDWAEETSSVITASNGTASRIYYMARLIAIDRMSELFLTFYEHDSADPKDITNVCKSMMDAVEPYKVVTLVMDYIDDKKIGEHLEVDCPSHLIRDADVLRRKGISVTRISAFAKPEDTQRFVCKHPNLDIASKLDSLAFDDDPYEYHDNEGVESISDIADNLLNPTYRKAIIKALQDKQEYYAEDEFDDANIAERAKDILDNLAEIFGSDEQED